MPKDTVAKLALPQVPLTTYLAMVLPTTGVLLVLLPTARRMGKGSEDAPPVAAAK